MTNYINKVINWKRERYTTMHSPDLKNRLLMEEVHEVVASATDLERVCELTDVVYIAIGALWKIGLSDKDIAEVLHACADSNATKSVTRTSYTMKANENDKGDSFVKKEIRIQEVLDGIQP